MAAYLSPIGNEQQSDASGNPLAGGFIYTYIAGTSTLAATFTDATGTIPQANPIVLNASGLPASPIYINGGSSMKFIIQNAASVTQRTIDNIQGVNDPAFTGATTEWINYSEAPTFLSTTSFSLVGDQTLVFQINRRIKTQNSGGTIYSTITNSVFGSGVTTITVINDSGVLDSGLSNVQYSLLSATNPSIPESVVGDFLRTAPNFSTAFATTRIDVASAATVNLTSLAPNTQHINITGNTTITGFTVAAGVYYFVRFDVGLTLTNNASIITNTGANILAAAGDTCIIRATAANVVEVLCYSGSKIKLATPVGLVAQTSVDFSSIPPWVNRINISATGVSTNGTSAYLVQLGDAGGIETTGYLGSSGGSTFSSGFIWANPGSAAAVVHAILQIQKLSGNSWVFCGNAALSSSAAQSTGAGSKSLSDTLTTVRITTASGTDTLDAGTVNISYE